MPKKNAFVMYMETRRPEFVAAGHQLTGGFKELADLCSKGWEVSEIEKQRFAEDAKSYNERAKNGAPGKNQLPESSKAAKKGPQMVEDPFKFTDKDHLLHQSNREIVNKLFDMVNTDWWKQPIVICTFTLYVEPGYDLMFLPAEIGLSAMNMTQGVFDNFGRIIDPTPVPKGHGVEVVQTAEKLGLPPIATVPEFANLETLMMNLVDFLTKHKGFFGGKDLYLFAFDSDFLTVSRSLEWLFERTKLHIPVKVLSLDQYAYLATCKTKRVCGDLDAVAEGRALEALFLTAPNPVQKISKYRKSGKTLAGNFVYHANHPTCRIGIFLNQSDVDEVIKEVDNYKYFEELCCVYHVKAGKQIHRCALNISNRYAFSLLEILTWSNEVPIIPGGHHPTIDKSVEEKNRRFDMLQKWGITKYELDMEVQPVEEYLGAAALPERARRFYGGRRGDHNGRWQDIAHRLSSGEESAGVNETGVEEVFRSTAIRSGNRIRGRSEYTSEGRGGNRRRKEEPDETVVEESDQPLTFQFPRHRRGSQMSQCKDGASGEEPFKQNTDGATPTMEDQPLTRMYSRRNPQLQELSRVKNQLYGHGTDPQDSITIDAEKEKEEEVENAPHPYTGPTPSMYTYVDKELLGKLEGI